MTRPKFGARVSMAVASIAAILLLAAPFPARAQSDSGKSEFIVNLVRISLRSSDCANRDVSNAWPAVGRVTLAKNGDSGTRAFISLTGAAANMKYRVLRKCGGELGSVITDGSGRVSRIFGFQEQWKPGLAIQLVAADGPEEIIESLPTAGKPTQSDNGKSEFIVNLVRISRRSTDCANADVSNAWPAVGRVTLAKNGDNGSRAFVTLTSAAANRSYRVLRKCGGELGSVTADGNGRASSIFGFQERWKPGLAIELSATDKSGDVIESLPATGGEPVPLLSYVQLFAPELRFDRAAPGYGYPMSAQPFYEAIKRWRAGQSFQLVENRDRLSLGAGTIPTYYQARLLGKQIRINYWWFYGYQHACFAGAGAHNGDWEHVMVTLKEDHGGIAAVTYFQHGGSYTRIFGPHASCQNGNARCRNPGIPASGSHPIVYVGKIGHGSYYDDNSVGPGGCDYYADFRNPASSGDYLSTQRNLVDLDSNRDDEEWMVDDRKAGQGKEPWTWGPDGVSRHPTQDAPTVRMPMCVGSSGSNVGCFRSECFAGDDEHAVSCMKQCKPGYVTDQYHCKPTLPNTTLYSRPTYTYDFTIPATDIGLARPRSSPSDWDLP